MKFIIPTLLFLLAASSAFAQRHISTTTADALNKRMLKGADTVFVVNFWATWCGPCVKELPEFDALQYEFSSKKVKVLLVSMDFPDSYPEKLEKYVAAKAILPEVLWFTETNATEFIPKLAPKWSGALPATIVVRAAKKISLLLEKSITQKELSEVVKQSL